MVLIDNKSSHVGHVLIFNDASGGLRRSHFLGVGNRCATYFVFQKLAIADRPDVNLIAWWNTDC